MPRPAKTPSSKSKSSSSTSGTAEATIHDQVLTRGAGGELHQVAEDGHPVLTTAQGPPGIDFSNDPLLQGRNFSYLDTQIKRLGGPNFTHIPINAPKCPMHHFQQDGHMAMRNPIGRVNYQPNSFGEGPRESPIKGFRRQTPDSGCNLKRQLLG